MQDAIKCRARRREHETYNYYLLFFMKARHLKLPTLPISFIPSGIDT